MTHLARIADRVLNRPLLIHPQKAEVIAYVLGGRIGLDEVMRPAPEANRFFGTASERGPYKVVDGVAVITIEGSLVNRGAWLGTDSGLVSYEGIAAQITAAAQDEDVSGIILDIDSPGGEAGGMAGLAETIRAAREVKPIVALVNDMAASAGYGIAASTNHIVVSPSSIVGSIGVVMLHADHSGELKQRGIAPTLIFAGEHKVDGHPFGPLPASVKADLQREVDATYDLFLEVIEAGRGDRLSASAARATEARILMGREAIEEGLADSLGGLPDAIAAVSELISTGPVGPSLSSTRSISMSERTEGAPGAENPGNEPKAKAKTPAPKAEPQSETQPAADPAPEPKAADPRERVKAILKADAAKGREELAEHLAFDTDMAADAAVAMLEKAPKANATATIAERAKGNGADVSAAAGRSDSVAAMWDAAAAKVNAQYGVTPRRQ